MPCLLGAAIGLLWGYTRLIRECYRPSRGYVRLTMECYRPSRGYAILIRECYRLTTCSWYSSHLPRGVTCVGESHVSGPQSVQLSQCTQAAVYGVTPLHPY